jgi:hypothetical protein
MNPKAFLLLTAVATLLLGGCSKKSATAAGDVPVEERKPVGKAAPATETNPIIEAGLQDLNAKVKAGDFEAAIGALVTLKGFPKSEKEQEAYRMQYRAVQEELSRKAAEGDERAKMSRDMLMRMIKGR